MNPKLVVLLGFLALVVLTLALFIGRDHIEQPETDDEPLVPELREQVNEIAAIDILGVGEQPKVRLRRERDRWRVMEKSGYEADFALVHDLLRDLAEVRRVEERTSSSEWYPRLGVSGPDAAESEGATVSFPDTGLPEIIVGHADSAGIGRYMRIRNQSTSWLTDRAPEVPVAPLEWLERAIMDIPASELSGITIRHPDGETVRLRSTGQEREQWVVVNVPEGREAAPAWQLQPIAGALTALTLEDVRENRDIPDDTVRALFRTHDGLNFVASLFREDGRHWLHFSVSAEIEASDEEMLDEDDAALAVDAAAVDERLSPWQFAIPGERFEDMTPRLQDVLADSDH